MHYLTKIPTWLLIVLSVFIISHASAQKIFQDDFTLQQTTSGPTLNLKFIFVAHRLDSVRLIVSENPYIANHSYNNTLWLDLNAITDINAYTNRILSAVFGYTYGAVGTDNITCTGSPCTLPNTLPSGAEWAAFQNSSQLYLRNRIVDIRKGLLTDKIRSGVLQIQNSAQTSLFIFHYTFEKNEKGEIFYSLLESSTMNGNTAGVEGLNSFDRLIGENAEQLSTQFFNLIKSVKGNTIYDNEKAFYEANVITLNDMVIEIMKLRGKYFDLGTIPDRFGYIRVGNIMPVYQGQDDVINFEKVSKYYQRRLNTAETNLLKIYPFLPVNWKFVPINSATPAVGNFKLRTAPFAETVGTDVLQPGSPIDLRNDGKGGNYYRNGNKLIMHVEIDSVDIHIVDGEIYSYSFWLKDNSKIPSVDKFQYMKLRFPIKELSKSMFKFYNYDYLYLHEDSGSPFYTGGETFLVHPSDVIFFEHPDQLNNRIFTSVDTVFRFRSTNNQINVTQKLREKGLLSIIDLDVFGDLVGYVDEDKPNGLIQAELKFNFYLNRVPLGEQYSQRSRFYFVNKFEFRARAGKIDNKGKFIGVLNGEDANGNAVKYIHAINLYKYQNLFVDLKLDITNWDFGNVEWANYGRIGILRSNLRDTIIEDDGTNISRTPFEFRLNSLKYSFGSLLRFFRTHDINIDMDVEALFIRPSSDNILLSKSEYDEFRVTRNVYIPSKKQALLWHPKLHFTYNFDRTRSRRLIARIEFMWENEKFGNNNFFAQIGYSADLNRFINLNKPSIANY